MRKIIFLFIGLFLIFCGTAFAANYPNHTGFVNDFAQVLSSGFNTQLNSKLSDFHRKTTDSIVVVTVNTTQPETIEQYSIHLADKWKVGEKGKDNGIIMLFAMKDRRMRIEVGRGLEGDLTDIQSKHIETDVISPEFKQGHYEFGIDKGVSAVEAAITHDASAAGSLLTNSNTQTQSSPIPSIVIIFAFIIIFIIFIAISPYTPLGGRGTWGPTVFWGEGGGSGGGSDDSGFGGGGFSGGGSSSSW